MPAPSPRAPERSREDPPDCPGTLPDPHKQGICRVPQGGTQLPRPPRLRGGRGSVQGEKVSETPLLTARAAPLPALATALLALLVAGSAATLFAVRVTSVPTFAVALSAAVVAA